MTSEVSFTFMMGSFAFILRESCSRSYCRCSSVFRFLQKIEYLPVHTQVFSRLEFPFVLWFKVQKALYLKQLRLSWHLLLGIFLTVMISLKRATFVSQVDCVLFECEIHFLQCIHLFIWLHWLLVGGTPWLSGCGAWAQLPRSIWDLLGPGSKTVSPALQGRFSTTGLPGSPLNMRS